MRDIQWNDEATIQIRLRGVADNKGYHTRKATIAAFNGLCYACGKRCIEGHPRLSPEAHHLISRKNKQCRIVSYERKGRERPGIDTILLCKWCHLCLTINQVKQGFRSSRSLEELEQDKEELAL